MNAMYKCNLDIVMSLPTGQGNYVDTQGNHCAMGKIFAGIIGRPLDYMTDNKPTPPIGYCDPRIGRNLCERLANQLIEKIGHGNFQNIYVTNDGQVPTFTEQPDGSFTAKANLGDPEQALYMALDLAVKRGFIELTSTKKLEEEKLAIVNATQEENLVEVKELALA